MVSIARSMTHLDADTVLAWIDGELSGARAAEVEAHIDDCAACRRLVSEAAATAAPEATDIAVQPTSVQALADLPSVPLDAATVPSRFTEIERIPPRARPADKPRRRWRWMLAAIVVVLAAAAAVWLQWPKHAPAAQDKAPTLTRLVRRQGQVLAARRGPDGFYASVAFGDGVGIDGMDALRIVRVADDGGFVPVPDTKGMAIVAANAQAIAVLRDAKMQSYQISGRLALIDGTGKPLTLAGDLTDIVAADFLPDGSLAVIRQRDRVYRLEAPIGKLVYQSPGQLWTVRVSPKGTIAFVEATLVDVRQEPTVKTLDRNGQPQLLAGGWREPASIAWSGEQIVVSGNRDATTNAIWVGPRQVWTAAHPVVLQDITAGAVAYVELVGTHHTFVGRAGWARDRDLSWSDRTPLIEMSTDGNWISVLDQSKGNYDPADILVRSTKGGEAVMIGHGVGGILSRDGRLVASRSLQPPWKILVTELAEPTWDGATPAHDVRMLDSGDITYFYNAAWAGNELVLLAEGPQGVSLYVQPLDGPPKRRGGWPAMQRALFRVSPDGKYVGDVDREGNNPAIIELATLTTTPIPNHTGETIVGWSTASDAVWIADLRHWPVVVTRHPLSGPESRQLSIPAPNPGALPVERVRVAGDGTTYAYSTATAAFELYRLDGAL
jgi:putative zinc finger protein